MVIRGFFLRNRTVSISYTQYGNNKMYFTTDTLNMCVAKGYFICDDSVPLYVHITGSKETFGDNKVATRITLGSKLVAIMLFISVI